MIALWYRDGALERAPYQDRRLRFLWRIFPMVSLAALNSPDLSAAFGAVETTVYLRHELAKGTEVSAPVWVPWTRTDRRALARRYGGAGRRGALAVSRGRWLQHPPRSRIVTLLYLPQGESVEARHLADVERWLLEHCLHVKGDVR